MRLEPRWFVRMMLNILKIVIINVFDVGLHIVQKIVKKHILIITKSVGLFLLFKKTILHRFNN